MTYTFTNEIGTSEKNWIVDKAFNVQRETEPEFTANKDRIAQFVSAAMDSPTLFIVLAKDEKNDNAGFMLAAVTQGAFINNLMAMDAMIHIEKTHKSLLPELLTKYEEWAIERGASAVYLTKATKPAKQGFENCDRHAVKFL